MEGRSASAPQRAPAVALPKIPGGGFVVLDDELHYRISAYDRMAPFLMTIPSASDLWMFVASGGGLTAGRIDADGSLFPYLTVDQLHDAHHHTGPVTLIRLEQAGQAPILWEPFHGSVSENSAIERNLYKSVTGNRLVFEEVHHEHGLAFRYGWSACDEFGWIRSATLVNRNPHPVSATLLDGLRNILPYGVTAQLYRQSSNLIDAYKKSEVDAETGLGIFTLTAGITDRAEAIEVLRANTVWSCGLPGARIHLSGEAVEAFRSGRLSPSQERMNGARGNYLMTFHLDLEAGETTRWHLAGDTGRDHGQIAELRQVLIDNDSPEQTIAESLVRATATLRTDVASADGLQLTGHPESWTHHFANVLFNNMRGGVFAKNYEISIVDLSDFLRTRNTHVAERQMARMESLADPISVQALRDTARQSGDADFERLCLEYLPLHFGRRHGDPSRPWNHFSIKVRGSSGERLLNYEGNWRDIFQNWEALCASFPGYLPNIVAKFVNASTVDGFNPYRINRQGVDWETVSPDDPWSNIGYWGDHQIIYLLKLLEGWDDHEPGAIASRFADEIYSYAEVPYRIEPYAEILRDPSATISFDAELAARIQERVDRAGSDGKLLNGPDGEIYHANLLEKLLVPALSKLSNLVPDGGIWMNTQRPEWNDANNALAGGGISVVTLCHLRRYLAFLIEQLAQTTETELPLSTEVADWFQRISNTLESERPVLAAESLSARERKRVLDALGESFSAYRERVYARGFSGRTNLGVAEVIRLCRTALEFIDWGLAANARQDGLYHTYNMLKISDDGEGAEVARLPVMLEGQVAILSSGVAGPKESLDVLERMYASELYVPEQRTFLLYPEKTLPGFLAKNRVPNDAVTEIPLLRSLLAAGRSEILVRDAEGTCRFNANLSNVTHLDSALKELGRFDEWSAAVARDGEAVRNLFNVVFGHDAYTGRSGAMYGYEGLGCIYWHMVAKLLLAVQETGQRAEREDQPLTVREGLARMYYRIRSGIGYEKSVAKYGAFPTDPYSHTPPGGGAKQPGMTGQVKEEILTRRGELGIRIENGSLRFQPTLLRPDEFLEQPAEFEYYDHDGAKRELALSPGSLAFTLCQVPVIYEQCTGDSWCRVDFDDGSTFDSPDHRLDARLSRAVFERGGLIRSIRVGVPAESLSKV